MSGFSIKFNLFSEDLGTFLKFFSKEFVYDEDLKAIKNLSLSQKNVLFEISEVKNKLCSKI